MFRSKIINIQQSSMDINEIQNKWTTLFLGCRFFSLFVGALCIGTFFSVVFIWFGMIMWVGYDIVWVRYEPVLMCVYMYRVCIQMNEIIVFSNSKHSDWMCVISEYMVWFDDVCDVRALLLNVCVAVKWGRLWRKKDIVNKLCFDQATIGIDSL